MKTPDDEIRKGCGRKWSYQNKDQGTYEKYICQVGELCKECQARLDGFKLGQKSSQDNYETCAICEEKNDDTASYVCSKCSYRAMKRKVDDLQGQLQSSTQKILGEIDKKQSLFKKNSPAWIVFEELKSRLAFGGEE